MFVAQRHLSDMYRIFIVLFFFSAFVPSAFADVSQINASNTDSIPRNGYQIRLGTGIYGFIDDATVYFDYVATSSPWELSLQLYQCNSSYLSCTDAGFSATTTMSATQTASGVWNLTNSSSSPMSLNPAKYHILQVYSQSTANNILKAKGASSETAYPYGICYDSYNSVTVPTSDCAFILNGSVVNSFQIATSSSITAVNSPDDFVVGGALGNIVFDFDFVSNTPTVSSACVFLTDLTNQTNNVPICQSVNQTGNLSFSTSVVIANDRAYSWRAVLLDDSDVEIDSSELRYYTTGSGWGDLVGAPISLSVSSSSLSSQDLIFPTSQSEDFCNLEFPYDDSDIIQATVTYLPNALCRIINWTSTIPQTFGVQMSSVAVTILGMPPFSYIDILRSEIEAL